MIPLLPAANSFLPMKMVHLLCSELHVVSGRLIHRYLEDNRISRDDQIMERTNLYCTFPAEPISGNFMSHMCHIFETCAFHIHSSCWVKMKGKLGGPGNLFLPSKCKVDSPSVRIQTVLDLKNIARATEFRIPIALKRNYNIRRN